MKKANYNIAPRWSRLAVSILYACQGVFNGLTSQNFWPQVLLEQDFSAPTSLEMEKVGCLTEKIL